MKCILKLFVLTLAAAAWASAEPHSSPVGWKLIWSDEFDRAGGIDTTKWSPCERGKADWNDTMTGDPRCFELKGGRIQLRGIANDGKDPADKAAFLTGGLTSKGKFSFRQGKIEVRARFKSAAGAWPAIWLLGADGNWPANGEIDLMEHLNFDGVVHQTVHSTYTVKIDKTGKPLQTSASPVERDDFNVYGAEWNADEVRFSINGKPTFSYPRVPAKGRDQWPFDQPFYIILSMQIGGTWVGKPDPKDYPAWVEVDWVRVYSRSLP